ncbi:MAG: fumarylacetoacetate hydrolase family protein [Gammaproteobacteria bacterium]
MHLISFSQANRVRVGVLDIEQRQVVDLQQVDERLPGDMLTFISQGSATLAAAHEALASGKGRIAQEQVTLLAPIPRPARNILCIGKNYRAHVQELQHTGSALLGGDRQDAPEKPIFFTKATTTVIGPNVPIPARLDTTHSTDYEGELAVIIGQGGRGIQPEDALQHVYGYSILTDVTSRRLLGDHQQWFLGKSLDGYCPMGPAIVTADEITDVSRLRVQTWVDDELRQDDVVASMIFDIPSQIATLSRAMTLEPGDIIATGTPAGVGMGFKPPRYLQRGNMVKIAIAPIGVLENPVD